MPGRIDLPDSRTAECMDNAADMDCTAVDICMGLVPADSSSVGFIVLGRRIRQRKPAAGVRADRRITGSRRHLANCMVCRERCGAWFPVAGSWNSADMRCACLYRSFGEGAVLIAACCMRLSVAAERYCIRACSRNTERVYSPENRMIPSVRQ